MDEEHIRDTADGQESNFIDLAPHAVEAVSDLLTDVGIEVEPHEAEIIANEILEKFTFDATRRGCNFAGVDHQQPTGRGRERTFNKAG